MIQEAAERTWINLYWTLGSVRLWLKPIVEYVAGSPIVYYPERKLIRIFIYFDTYIRLFGLHKKIALDYSNLSEIQATKYLWSFKPLNT